MNRNTKFIAPFHGQRGPRHYFRAMINGVWVEAHPDEYGDLLKRFETERAAYQKAQRAAKKKTAEANEAALRG